MTGSHDGMGWVVLRTVNLDRLSSFEALLLEPDAGQIREGASLVIAFLQQLCVDPIGHGDGDALGFSSAVVDSS